MLYYAIWDASISAWLTLSGPFEYPGWVSKDRGADAARLPAWKAYQIMNWLNLPSLQMVQLA